nr:hypothetical protein Iba_chr14aCG27420 [Ipomoea batatas]
MPLTANAYPIVTLEGSKDFATLPIPKPASTFTISGEDKPPIRNAKFPNAERFIITGSYKPPIIIHKCDCVNCSEVLIILLSNLPSVNIPLYYLLIAHTRQKYILFILIGIKPHHISRENQMAMLGEEPNSRNSFCVATPIARRELGDAVKMSQIGMIFAAVVGENSLAAAGKEGKKANVLVVCP